MSWFGDKTSQLNFSSGPKTDPAYRWDTKRKLISLVEVCSLPSALLVAFDTLLMCCLISPGHWQSSREIHALLISWASHPLNLKQLILHMIIHTNLGMWFTFSMAQWTWWERSRLSKSAQTVTSTYNKHRHCTNPRRCGLILRSLLWWGEVDPSDLDLWPLHPKINRVLGVTIPNRHTKFSNHGAHET